MSWQVGLYVAAVLIPLVAFAIEAIFIRQLKRWNAYIATGAIFLSFILSFIGFAHYFFLSGDEVPWAEAESHVAAEEGESHELPGERPISKEPAHSWAGHFNWISLGSAAGDGYNPCAAGPGRPAGCPDR